MTYPLTIRLHRYPVVLSAAEVARRRDVAARSGGDPFAPERCPYCSVEANYRIDSVWRTNELLVVFNTCGNCGEKSEDYLD